MADEVGTPEEIQQFQQLYLNRAKLPPEKQALLEKAAQLILPKTAPGVGVPQPNMNAQPVSIFGRAMMNLPASVGKSITEPMKGLQMGQGSAYTPADESQPDLGRFGNFKRSIAPVLHPIDTLKEQFANDPVSLAKMPVNPELAAQYIQRPVQGAASAVVGAGKGLTDIPLYKSLKSGAYGSIIGGELGRSAGAGEVGGIVGAATQVVPAMAKGAYKGFQKGISDYDVEQISRNYKEPQVKDYSPKDTSISEHEAKFGAKNKSPEPVEKEAGSPPLPKPEEETMKVRNPSWKDLPEETEEKFPEIEHVKAQLPSGRTPGSLTKAEEAEKAMNTAKDAGKTTPEQPGHEAYLNDETTGLQKQPVDFEKLQEPARDAKSTRFAQHLSKQGIKSAKNLTSQQWKAYTKEISEQSGTQQYIPSVSTIEQIEKKLKMLTPEAGASVVQSPGNPQMPSVQPPIQK